jgi:hypothetical protein
MIRFAKELPDLALGTMRSASQYERLLQVRKPKYCAVSGQSIDTPCMPFASAKLKPSNSLKIAALRSTGQLPEPILDSRPQSFRQNMDSSCDSHQFLKQFGAYSTSTVATIFNYLMTAQLLLLRSIQHPSANDAFGASFQTVMCSFNGHLLCSVPTE